MKLENINVNYQLVTPLEKELIDELNDLKIIYIIFLITKYTGVDFKTLKLKTRKREVVLPRQMCMYFIKNNTKYKGEQIGNIFGKDSTTVIHGCKTVQNLIDTYAGSGAVDLSAVKQDIGIDARTSKKQEGDTKSEIYAVGTLLLFGGLIYFIGFLAASLFASIISLEDNGLPSFIGGFLTSAVGCVSTSAPSI